ncbi:hypothetical protein QBC41DRAFT_303479 [Cercophora samala]|uniref:Uncharacterized protein n=1 Tax=Cercophora samala TaxID=330535 RepID=A0AA40DAZ2_9PEZI|nr:hypothetical protein QBC41DRAFT_303479 [Cercophora samala]
MRVSTHLPLPILLGVFATSAHANWNIRSTEDFPAPTSVEDREALEDCLFTSNQILRSQPTPPPELREYSHRAANDAGNDNYYVTATDPIERLDPKSVCSVFLGIPTRQLSMLPSELSTVFSTYREAKSSWIAQVKPKVSEFSQGCIEVLGTTIVVEYLQEFVTELGDCMTNFESIYGTFVHTGEWKPVSTPVSTSVTTTSSTAAGARETGYMVPVLGVVGAAAWAGAALV